MKDLTKILKTGDTVYFDLTGEYHTITVDDDNKYPIELVDKDDRLFTQITAYGQMYHGYPDGKCVIWPEKDVRSWDNYSRFKQGDMVLVWNTGTIAKTPAIYFGKDPNGGHFTSVYVDGKLRIGESFDNCVHITSETIEKSIDDRKIKRS